MLLATACLARDYAYTSMDVRADLLKDGTLRVKEAWVMDFSGHYTQGYRMFYTDTMQVSGFTVSSDGRRFPVERAGGGGEVEYTWPIDVTDEAKTYEMEYTVKNAIQSGLDSDVLLYTVVFKDREKPVGTVHFELTLPEDVQLSSIPHRSTHGVLAQAGPRTVSLDAHDVPALTPLDVELELPKGVVDVPFDWVGLVLSLAWLLLVGGGWVVVLVLSVWSVWHVHSEWSKHGKDPVVVYKSKMLANLKPAIAGLVVDESAGINEIIATILDLAIRGYVRIDQKDSLFGLVKDQQLTLLKPDYSQLEGYEAELLRKLFGQKKAVTTSELDNAFYKHIDGLTKMMDKTALQIGLFDAEPDTVRAKYAFDFLARPLLALFLCVGLMFLSFASPVLIMRGPLVLVSIFSMALGMSSVPLMFVLIVGCALVAGAMPRKTVHGVQMKDKYVELKRWMATYPLREQRLFDEFLPYAVAFGIGDVWVRKMEKLGRIERSWYHGHLTVSSFNAFHSSMSRSLASSPSSSGGGGHGGGFGGGGGAGGGGGGFR